MATRHSPQGVLILPSLSGLAGGPLMCFRRGCTLGARDPERSAPWLDGGGRRRPRGSRRRGYQAGVTMKSRRAGFLRGAIADYDEIGSANKKDPVTHFVQTCPEAWK